MSYFEVIPEALRRQALLFRKENNPGVFLKKTFSLHANEIKRQRLENLCRIYPHPGPVLCPSGNRGHVVFPESHAPH